MKHFEITHNDGDIATLYFGTDETVSDCVHDIQDSLGLDNGYCDLYVYAQTLSDSIDNVLTKVNVHEAQVVCGLSDMYIEIEVDSMNANIALEALNNSSYTTLIHSALVHCAKGEVLA